MIRKILSMAVIALMVFGVTSCMSEQQKKCSEIAQAMENGDFDTAEDISNELYAHRADCNATTLTDLATAYITFVGVNTSKGDVEEAIEAMRRTIVCYDAAMKKDSVEAKKRWSKIAEDMEADGSPVSPIAIVNSFKKQLSMYDAATAATAVSDTTSTSQAEAVSEKTAEIAIEGVAAD